MKVLAIFFSAALALVGVACSSGPPEEFCDALQAYVAVTADQEAANAAGSAEAYAQLETTVAELITQLNVMEDAVGDDDVKSDIIATREGYEAFQETGDVEVLTEEVSEAEQEIYAYGAECEGFEPPTAEDAASDASEEDTAAEGGITPEIESTLVNAATAQESYFTSDPSTGYASEVSILEENGLELPEGITLTIEPAGDGYCMTAEDADGNVGHISSDSTEVEEGPC